SSTRLTTATDAMISVSATTPTAATVRRAWNVRGVSGRRSRSALSEGVPDSPDRQHERRRRRVVLDLLAQVADVDVDRLLVLVEGLVVAQELEQLGPGVDASGPARQVAQDLELRRSERHASLAPLDPSPFEVDEQVAMADHPAAGRIRQVPVRPAQQRLDPAHELAQAERLGQVVVRAEL